MRGRAIAAFAVVPLGEPRRRFGEEWLAPDSEIWTGSSFSRKTKTKRSPMDDFKRSSCKKVEHFISDSDMPRRGIPAEMKRLRRREGRRHLEKSDRELFDYYLEQLRDPPEERDSGEGSPL